MRHFLFVLLMFVSQLSMSAPESTPNPTSLLQNKMQSLLDSAHAPGASYAVFDRNGVLASGAVGYAELSSQQAMTDTTLVRAGSITKTLTAIAVMQLIERGRFTINTPVRELLPALSITNPWESSHPVRVVHLLEHTAGFDDTSLSKMFGERENFEPHLVGVLNDPRPLHVRWQPGKMMSYSNPGYAILGAIIEQQSKLTWEAYVQKNVLLPLGMTRSVLSIGEATQSKHARAYRGADKRKVGLLFMPDRAAGALWSTPLDLSLLGRFLLTDGASAPAVLKTESVRAMKVVHSTDSARQGLNWGYGLGVERVTAAKTDWLGHDGGVYGAAAKLRYQPARELGYVVMVNTEEVGELATPLIDYVMAQPSVLPATATPARQAFRGDIDGWYRRRDNRPELGAGINWLLGVVQLTVDKADANIVHLQEPMGGGSSFSTNDNHLLRSEKTGLTRAALIRSGSNGEVVAVDNNGFYFERVSAISALAPLVLLPVSVLLLLTAPFGRRKVLKNPWLRRWPTLALMALVLAAALMFQLDITTLNSINVATAGIFIATLLLPIFALTGTLLCLKTWRTETARLAYWRCLLGALGALLLSVYFAAFHWFALALWNW